ncbi:metalloregulator ArsR/SmtB family transcription factor [Oceanospirillum sediminis]|uniref:Metalloregulator ArsR/SmtB family transcription factor n=1 Tax=Oceanospirillum sediminis TaxID=2760088 RepID=A0A839IRY3_9GAMM|nr:metalloregulator ArsR/SmtB family transcription factor [Oceanospirillum sediminis]
MDAVQFFKCLADDTRLRCILLIEKEDELCVCELMAALGDSQPKISRHLALLRKSGLLQDRRQGQWVFYQLAPSLPEWCKQLLHDATEANEAMLQENLENLKKMGDSRPERVLVCCD